MFQQFSPPAHHVVELAQQESDRLGHNYLGPEHVLAGIAGQTDDRAARMLRTNGVDLRAIRTGIDRLVSNGVLPPPWRHDANLFSGFGIDIAAVRRNVEETFGGDAVDESNSQDLWMKIFLGGFRPALARRSCLRTSRSPGGYGPSRSSTGFKHCSWMTRSVRCRVVRGCSAAEATEAAGHH